MSYYLLLKNIKDDGDIKCLVFKQTVSQANFDLEFLSKFQWICLLNTIPMVSIAYFYDYWSKNYQGKCQESWKFNFHGFIILYLHIRYVSCKLTAIYSGYSPNFQVTVYNIRVFHGRGLGKSSSSRRQRAADQDRLGYLKGSEHGRIGTDKKMDDWDGYGRIKDRKDKLFVEIYI